MANIETIRKKIDQLISQNGLNYRDVSLKIGRKDSYIHQYVKYGYPRRLKEIDRIRLAHLLHVDDQDLMDDEIISSKAQSHTLVQPADLTHIVTENLLHIDIINDHPTSQDREKILEDVFNTQHIAPDLIDPLYAENPHRLKIVKINNDSMKPSVNPGDMVWFDSSYAEPQADGLYLLNVGKELMVKRIQTSPIDGSVEILSDNPNYKTYRAACLSDVKVLGKVVYLFQKI